MSMAFSDVLDKVTGLYARIGGLVGTTLLLIAVGIYVHDHSVPAWVPLAVGALALLLIPLSYLLGRRAWRQLSPETAERARDQLHAATAYLSHVDDFHYLLREAFVRPEQSLENLEKLRRVVFDTLVQGVNVEHGEHIRCAFLVPRKVGGETRLVIRYHQGHTAMGEQKLALYADPRSIAGTAFTEGKPIYIPDAGKDPRMQKTTGGREIGTLYCLPVFEYGAGEAKALGVLSVSSNRVGAFASKADEEFVSICASMIAMLEVLTVLLQAFRDLGRLATEKTTIPRQTSPPGGSATSPPNVTVEKPPSSGGDE
jgi:hypothetical protein